MFAKLFESEDHGQILVKCDTNDDQKPEVRLYFEPEGLGVCSMAYAFNDTDEGWDQCDVCFGNMNLETASKIVSNIVSKMGGTH